MDRLRHGGVELQVGTRLFQSIDVSANYTRLDPRHISDPNSPVGDSYGTKLTADVVYRHNGGRLLLGYSGRHNGEQSNMIIGARRRQIGGVAPGAQHGAVAALAGVGSATHRAGQRGGRAPGRDPPPP